jgi:predicted ArsR family transcriptional regulator
MTSDDGSDETARMTEVHLSARQIQVLAHPLRIRLLGQLRLNGPATATGLAEVLATNTGATSYHLRQLADAGLVVEENRPDSGRQRWWRALHELSSWQRSDYADDPAAAAAVDWMEAYQLNLLVQRIEAWRLVAPAEPAEWRDVSGLGDYALTMAPEQLRDMQTDLEELVERHRLRALDDPQPGARQVLFFYAGVPDVGDQR